MATNLRHWRWFIFCLLFSHILMLTITPVRASSPAVAYRRPISSTLGRSHRSTEDYEGRLTDGIVVSFVFNSAITPQPELFAGISEDGTLEMTEEPKHILTIHVVDQISPRDGKGEGKYQKSIRLSDKTKRWFLCINGNEIVIKKVAPRASQDECTWILCTWIVHKKATNLQIQPFQDPQRSLHFGEYTLAFLKVALRVDLQSKKCTNSGSELQFLAQKELSQAYKLFNYLQKVQLQVQKPPFKLPQTVVNIISDLIEIRTELKLLQWDCNSLTASIKKESVGIFGNRYHATESQEEKIISYANLKAKGNRFVSREKALVRKLFAGTNKLPEWNRKSLVAFRNHPSFSNLLRGLKLLRENETDLEDNLYLIGRYLSKTYIAEPTLKLTPSSVPLQERAVLLKLEEMVEKKMDHYFLSCLRCLGDWLKQLTASRRSNNFIIDETAPKISKQQRHIP
ncbi:hypothetical protein Aperf_G00000092818 [Anoplocephala perfoliata]